MLIGDRGNRLLEINGEYLVVVNSAVSFVFLCVKLTRLGTANNVLNSI